MMFSLFAFLMADIAAMHRTAQDIWIPKSMRDSSQPPKIAGFAAVHDPALLYAEILRKYASNPSLIGLTSNTSLQQWYTGKETSGYFCRHDNFISFVVGEKNLINDQKKLQGILDSFKAKYQSIKNWDVPAVMPGLVFLKEEQKIEMQTVADENKENKNLLKFLCKVGGVQSYSTTCPILYRGKYNAAPYVHPYTNFDVISSVFELKGMSSTFINFEFVLSLDKGSNIIQNANPAILYRPHAYLGATITPADYMQSSADKKWKVEAEVSFLGGHVIKIEGEAHIHDQAPNAVASPNNMAIGNLLDLSTGEPFVSRMKIPYNVTTLHILVNGDQKIPNTAEQLLNYLSQLPLDQQKFIIKQLFPFLQL